MYPFLNIDIYQRNIMSLRKIDITMNIDRSSVLQLVVLFLDGATYFGYSRAIGIQFVKEESLKRKINLINKDSLVIRRSLSLSNLSSIISKLNDSGDFV